MTYDILIDNEYKTKVINEFVKNIQNNINNIDTSLRNDFIEYNINILKQKIGCDNNLNNLLNYFFEIKKIAGDYSLSKTHKLKYFNNNCDIVLIAQYYNTTDEQRHKENTGGITAPRIRRCIKNSNTISTSLVLGNDPHTHPLIFFFHDD